MIDEKKLFKKYPEKLLEKMKENIVKEYPADYRRNDPISKRSQQVIREFKELMQRLTGSQLPRKVELQLTVLEDITMNFLTPYTRQLLIDRILKQQENNKSLNTYDSIEDVVSHKQ